MKKILKWVGIIFIALFAIGLVGKLMGVEPIEVPKKDIVEPATNENEEVEEDSLEKEPTKKVEGTTEGNSTEKSSVVEKNKEVAKPAAKEEKIVTWHDDVLVIANNADIPADKLYALEKYMMEYKPTKKEIKQFQEDIVRDYKEGKYLTKPNDHDYMLSNIFKSYIVEQNTKKAMKDFAFDYFQNIKYVYRGVDTVDGAEVQANESQMEKALLELK